MVARPEVTETETKRRSSPNRMAFTVVALAVLSAVALWLVPILQVEPARERLAISEQIAPADRLALVSGLLKWRVAAS